MATFKVGDRVRIVALPPRTHSDYDHLIGAEGVIVQRGIKYDWWVRVPGFHQERNILLPADCAPPQSKHLAPLTPPAQDEWADAKVKQVTKPVYTRNPRE